MTTPDTLDNKATQHNRHKCTRTFSQETPPHNSTWLSRATTELSRQLSFQSSNHLRSNNLSFSLSESQDAQEECEAVLGRSEEDVGQLKAVWEKTEEILGPAHSARFKVHWDNG